MGRAFVNSLLVAVPTVILPILFAAFAGYAFSWLHFRGRMWLFALLVGLQIVPLQMTLIPVSRVYAQLGLNGTFLGIWLFHTGFGLPYAIYLMRNFLGSLPRDLFESHIWMGPRTGQLSGGWPCRYRCQLLPRWPSSSSCGFGMTF
jgi:alpha-glucoside transport system permease protein